MFFEKEKQKYQHRISEFQAIVLAGYGSSNRLYPLTEEENLPKSLLPVANRPLISYTLDWLEKAGITEVIVLTQTDNSANQKLSAYIRSYSGALHLNLITIDDDAGTADALRIVKDKIDRDFIVLSCDMITDLIPSDILDYHRVQDPTVTALFYEPGKSEGGGSGKSEGGKEADTTQYVGIDTSKARLVYVGGASAEGDFTLRMSLLWKFPRVTVHTNLRDAHLYIFKHWVIDLIAAKENISSIRLDLLPLLVKCQYQRSLVAREGIAQIAMAGLASSISLDPAILALSTTADLEEDERALVNAHGFVSPVKAQVYVFRQGFCERGNTVASYCDLNRHILKQSTITRVPPSAEVSPKAQVGFDSMIGEHTRIDERSSVKRSTIGAHCVVGKNVKISNSVVMDHVVVEDNVKLDNCVVCNHVRILEKAQLKDCEVAGGMTVEKESQVKGEQLGRGLLSRE